MSCPLPARRPPVARPSLAHGRPLSHSSRTAIANHWLPLTLFPLLFSLFPLLLSRLSRLSSSSLLFLPTTPFPSLFFSIFTPLGPLYPLYSLYFLPSTLYPLPTRSRLPKSSQCYPYKRYTIAISGDATPGLVSASPDGRPPLQRYHPTITLSRQQQRPVPPPSTAPFSPPTTNFLPPFPPGHKTHTHARNGKRPRQHTSTQLPPNCLAALATRAAAIRFV